MWITWYAFGFVQIGLQRWFKHVTDLNNYFHAFLGWFIITITIYSVAALTIDPRESQTKIGENGAGPHFIIGYIVSGIMLLFTVSGIFVFMIRKLLKWDTRSIIIVRRMHRNSAFAVWVLGQVASYYGIISYIRTQISFTDYLKLQHLPLISLTTGFGIAILFEIYFQIAKSLEDDFKNSSNTIIS